MKKFKILNLKTELNILNKIPVNVYVSNISRYKIFILKYKYLNFKKIGKL